MTSDDLAALAAISLGALVAITATVTLIDSDPTLDVHDTGVRLETPALTPLSTAPVVDFAIIREQGELMVGPEGSGTGWSPPQDSRSPGPRRR